MKKNIAFSLVIIGFTLLSCKKSYQCDCNSYDSNGNYQRTSSNTYNERKREDAQAACVAKSFATQAETVRCVITN